MAKPMTPRRYWGRLLSQHATPGKDRSKSRKQKKSPSHSGRADREDK